MKNKTNINCLPAKKSKTGGPSQVRSVTSNVSKKNLEREKSNLSSSADCDKSSLMKVLEEVRRASSLTGKGNEAGEQKLVEKLEALEREAFQTRQDSNASRPTSAAESIPDESNNLWRLDLDKEELRPYLDYIVCALFGKLDYIQDPNIQPKFKKLLKDFYTIFMDNDDIDACGDGDTDLPSDYEDDTDDKKEYKKYAGNFFFLDNIKKWIESSQFGKERHGLTKSRINHIKETAFFKIKQAKVLSQDVMALDEHFRNIMSLLPVFGSEEGKKGSPFESKSINVKRRLEILGKGDKVKKVDRAKIVQSQETIIPSETADEEFENQNVNRENDYFDKDITQKPDNQRELEIYSSDEELLSTNDNYITKMEKGFFMEETESKLSEVNVENIKAREKECIEVSSATYSWKEQILKERSNDSYDQRQSGLKKSISDMFVKAANAQSQPLALLNQTKETPLFEKHESFFVATKCTSVQASTVSDSTLYVTGREIDMNKEKTLQRRLSHSAIGDADNWCPQMIEKDDEKHFINNGSIRCVDGRSRTISNHKLSGSESILHLTFDRRENENVNIRNKNNHANGNMLQTELGKQVTVLVMEQVKVCQNAVDNFMSKLAKKKRGHAKCLEAGGSWNDELVAFQEVIIEKIFFCLDLLRQKNVLLNQKTDLASAIHTGIATLEAKKFAEKEQRDAIDENDTSKKTKFSSRNSDIRQVMKIVVSGIDVFQKMCSKIFDETLKRCALQLENDLLLINQSKQSNFLEHPRLPKNNLNKASQNERLTYREGLENSNSKINTAEAAGDLLNQEIPLTLKLLVNVTSDISSILIAVLFRDLCLINIDHEIGLGFLTMKHLAFKSVKRNKGVPVQKMEKVAPVFKQPLKSPNFRSTPVESKVCSSVELKKAHHVEQVRTRTPKKPVVHSVKEVNGIPPHLTSEREGSPAQANLLTLSQQLKKNNAHHMGSATKMKVSLLRLSETTFHTPATMTFASSYLREAQKGVPFQTTTERDMSPWPPPSRLDPIESSGKRCSDLNRASSSNGIGILSSIPKTVPKKVTTHDVHPQPATMKTLQETKKRESLSCNPIPNRASSKKPIYLKGVVQIFEDHEVAVIPVGKQASVEGHQPKIIRYGVFLDTPTPPPLSSPAHLSISSAPKDEQQTNSQRKNHP